MGAFGAGLDVRAECIPKPARSKAREKHDRLCLPDAGDRVKIHANAAGWVRSGLSEVYFLLPERPSKDRSLTGSNGAHANRAELCIASAHDDRNAGGQPGLC